MKLFTKFKMNYTNVCRTLKNGPLDYSFSARGRAWVRGNLYMEMKIRSPYKGFCAKKKYTSAVVRLLAKKRDNISRSKVLNYDLVSMISLLVLKLRNKTGAEEPNQVGKLTVRALKSALMQHKLVMYGRYLVVFIGLFIFGRVQAQLDHRLAIKPLEIGDTIPESLWSMPLEVVNHPSGKDQITLNDYRNKNLIILDFWATWCPPCIESLGKLSGLAQSNSKDMAGLAVATQNRAEIIRFFASREDEVSVPSVVKDSIFSTYFPHASVPHIIWIHDNKVHSITWHNAVTAENILAAAKGRQLSVMPKRENLSYNLHKPLAMDFNGGTSEDVLYHSLLTGFLEGVTGAGTETGEISYKIRAINTDILGLYKMAAIGIDPLLNYRNRNIINVQNEKTIQEKISPLYNPEVRDKFFSYELIIPQGLKKKAHGMMLEDLNRFFGSHSHIKGYIEKVATQCWVLKSDSGAVNLMSPEKTFVESRELKVYNNYPFRTFFRNVIAYRLRNESLPVIDETGLDRDVSITFPKIENDLGKLRSYLKTYGLYMEKEIREIDMLVIRDNNQ